jgi:DNA polymerase/3'-5' exonuclease PolX
LKDPTPLHIAGPRARRLANLLAPSCERIAIAGSIRRLKDEVGDIELVTVPAFGEEPDGLWGGSKPLNLLQARVTELVSDGTLEVLSGGERYAKLVFEGMQADLFMVLPPAQWGVILTIRTGPADFSQKMVTRARAKRMHVAGGALRYGMAQEECERGCECDVAKTPDEASFFRFLGLDMPPAAARE